MILVKKSHKDSYEVNFKKPIELFKAKHGESLQNEIEDLLNEDRKITVYLDSAAEISKSGYESLYKLIKLAKQEKCKLNFMYYGVDITERIELFSDET